MHLSERSVAGAKCLKRLKLLLLRNKILNVFRAYGGGILLSNRSKSSLTMGQCRIDDVCICFVMFCVLCRECVAESYARLINAILGNNIINHLNANQRLNIGRLPIAH